MGNTVSTMVDLVRFNSYLPSITLLNSLKNQGQTDAILLYFSKAFDKVSHQHLYHKLHHYGIQGHTLAWLKDFHTGRRQLVLVNGEQSDATKVTLEVPQGTVLAPLLFLCLINDLPNNILSTVRL